MQQFFCPLHNSEVVLIELNQEAKLGERALCMNCTLRNPIQIDKAIKKIKEYRQQEKEENQSILLSVAEKCKSLESMLDQILSKFNDYIKQARLEIQEQYKNFQNEIRKNTFWSIDPNRISGLDELQKLGEQFSREKEFKDNRNKKISLQKNFSINKEMIIQTLKEKMNEIFSFQPRYIQIIQHKISLVTDCQLSFKDQNELFAFSENQLSSYSILKNQNLELKQTLKLNQTFPNVKFVYFSFQNPYFLFGTKKGDILVYKDHLQAQPQEIQAHTKDIKTILFAKIRNQLISGSNDWVVKVFQSFQNGILVETQKFVNHYNDVNCLAVNEEETLLLSGSDDKNIIIYKFVKNWEFIQKIDKAHQFVASVCFTNSKQFVSSCSYGEVKLWNQKENGEEFYLRNSIKFSQSNRLNSSFHSLFKLRNSNFILYQKSDLLAILQIDSSKLDSKFSIASGGIYQNLQMTNDQNYLAVYNDDDSEIIIFKKE